LPSTVPFRPKLDLSRTDIPLSLRRDIEITRGALAKASDELLVSERALIQSVDDFVDIARQEGIPIVDPTGDVGGVISARLRGFAPPVREDLAEQIVLQTRNLVDDVTGLTKGNVKQLQSEELKEFLQTIQRIVFSSNTAQYAIV